MIMPFKGKHPQIDESCFIAENAVIIGDVTLEKNASVWFGAVLRGDCGSIHIGESSNIQENVTIHVDIGGKTQIGKNVTVGHNAVVHGATIGDDTLVGMSATVLDNANIGSRCIIGACALVPGGKEIPDGSLVMGVPGKVVKATSPEQVEHTKFNARYMVEEAKTFKSL